MALPGASVNSPVGGASVTLPPAAGPTPAGPGSGPALPSIPYNVPGGSGGGISGYPNYAGLAAGSPSNLYGIATVAGAYADTSAIFAGGESITGLTAGLEQAGSPSASGGLIGSGAQGAAADSGLFCPELVFRPLVVGCVPLPNPITGGGLANTGLPILIGLTGLLTMAAGWVLYVRSRAADPVTRPITAFGIAVATRRRGLVAIARTLPVERIRR